MCGKLIKTRTGYETNFRRQGGRGMGLGKHMAGLYQH